MHSKFRRGRRSGVTLIELLCAIAIIGILMGLLIGPVWRAYKKAKEVAGEGR
jgi:prepilin-type N-terminal cleavage/methylation domain-containing protein